MGYTYEEFLNKFVKEMENKLAGYNMEISIINRLRNNGILDRTIKVAMPGTNATATMSTLALYEHYKVNDNLDEMVNKLSENIIINFQKEIDAHSAISKENILDSLYLMVVNARANTVLLSETPHYLIANGELAVLPRLNINIAGRSQAIVVRNGMLPSLQMTGDEVLQIAKLNTTGQNLFEMDSLLSKVIGMMRVNGDDIPEDFSELFMEEMPKAFVVTNKDEKWGACCLACPDVIETIMGKMGMDCYIIPLSVHEVVFVEKRGDFEDLEYLRDVLHEANLMDGAPAEEILSDKIFEYNSKTRKIEIANTDQESKELPEAPHKNRGQHM